LTERIVAEAGVEIPYKMPDRGLTYKTQSFDLIE